MSKYAPLGDHLRRLGTEEIPMTFSEIEQVIGANLPEKAQNYPAWWSNNASNNVMTKIWLDAGYRTERVDVARRRLVFRKYKLTNKYSGPVSRKRWETTNEPKARTPLLGCMKGLVRVMPDTDLTAPADPEWGEHG